MKRFKKMMVSLMLMATLFICAIPVYAGKEYFAFTTSGTDKRTAPGTKSDTEQAAYITTTYHSSSKGVAIGVDNGSQYGVHTANWTFSKPTSKKKLGYMGYASQDYVYYIYYDPMGGSGTTIRGRYNP